MSTLKCLAFIGVVAIVSTIVVGIYFFGGYYNVAGTANSQTSSHGRWFASAPLRLSATLIIVHHCRASFR